MNTSKLSVTEEEISDDGPIVYYCSRTHSQLTQFASELQKVKLPPVVDEEQPEPELKSTTEPVSEALRHLTLGSRKNLCINPKVLKLGNNTAINEKCLDLQKSGVSEDKKCPYVPSKDDESVVNKFRDFTHSKIRDIEDLGKLGKAMCICPYYASRGAIQTSEIVTLPYPLLLQKSSREALGISLKDNIVIIDEAHNLMDAVCGLYSCSISLSQMRRGRGQLMTYLQKFKNMLKGKNRVYVAQCVRVLDSLVAYMETVNSGKAGHEGVCDAAKLLSGKGVDQINLFKLNNYIQKSKLARKVDGYTEFVADTSSGNTIPTKVEVKDPNTTPTLMQIQSFMIALMNPSKEGRFGYIVENHDVILRYMLLDPTSHFRDIVDEARSVILAGGTMSPMDDYFQYLFPYLSPGRIKTLSCSHIVPATSLNVFSVTHSQTGTDFDFKFSSRSNSGMIAAAGDALVNFIEVIPDGVVAFFPSYSYLEECVNTWKNTTSRNGVQRHQPKSIWGTLERLKPVFFESNSSQSATPPTDKRVHSTVVDVKKESVLSQFTSAVRCGKGGLLFAVISGSLSEGINFSDELGRGVVVFGLPYPNPHSAEWKAKMEYVTQSSRGRPSSKTGAMQSPAQEFYENATMRAVNQAVGRAIRHRDDYAAIMLVDKRYSMERIRKKLPGWMKDSIESETEVNGISRKLERFFARHQSKKN